MRTKMLTMAMATMLALCFTACDKGSDAPLAVDKSTIPADTVASTVVPVDYTLGRAMNARLGKGINLGNSWDSEGYDDGGWSNPIDDGDFKLIKDAGFNSVRLPVRFQNYSDYSTHTVDPARLQGVYEDVSLAIANGLAVVLDFHHYMELNALGGGAHRGRADSTALFQAEKEHFVGLWAQIATVFNAFPDSMLVFDILNEPTIPNAGLVNDVLLSAYTVIRAAAPGKTIMFESNNAAKFAQLSILKLPPDGNIIFSGHYYEPYTFSHQGNGYDCRGDALYSNNASNDFLTYARLAKTNYPDINGGYIPMNMGEFGVAGGNTRHSCFDLRKDPSGIVLKDSTGTIIRDLTGPSDQLKALWAKETVKAAETYGISFHYWGFTRVGGFEAYDRENNTWLPGFPEALIHPEL